MSNAKNILAGTKAGGPAGLSLAWFAPEGTTLPEDATTSLTNAFKDAGNCDPKGIDIKTNTSSTPIKSFGSLQPQGVLYTDQTQTVDVTFQETNPISVAVYKGLELDGVAVAPDGSFSVQTKMPEDIRYVAVFDAFSQFGDPLRFVAPNVSNTDPGDQNLQMGQVFDRAVTLTLYPDANGVSLYEFYVVSGLATEGGSTPAAWQAEHTYAVNDQVSNSGGVLKCTVAGVSDAEAPVNPGIGNTVVDNAVTWTQVS